MKKITALVLNDEEETSYKTPKYDTDIRGLLVKDIYFSFHELNGNLPIFVVEFDDDRDNIEVPYHSVLLIRREK